MHTLVVLASWVPLVFAFSIALGLFLGPRIAD